MPGMEESHAARRHEAVGRMVRTLLPSKQPPTARPAPGAITEDQRAALDRSALAVAELREQAPPPEHRSPLAGPDPGPEPGEVWVSGHFDPPIAARGREFLRLRRELVTDGSAWARFREVVFERDEGYTIRVVPGEFYLSVGRDPEHPAYERMVRLQRHGSAILEPGYGTRIRRARPARPADALAHVPFLAGSPDRPTSRGVIAGRPAVRGVDVIHAYVAKGYGIRTAGGRLLAELPGGHDPHGLIALLAIPRARDLLHGWVAQLEGSGQAPTCEHPDHAGDPVPAVTVALADVLACDECMAGRFTAAAPEPSS